MKNQNIPKNHKILIANRGEIAIRIMQACRKLGHAFVALFTEPDKHSEHCVLARKLGGEESLYRVSSYLDANEIFAVADHAGATAIHPGYGFFAEDYRFARRVAQRERKLIFIGPSWQVIRELGDKINTKRLARKLGVPTVPGSDKPVTDDLEAEGIAKSLFDFQKEQGVGNPVILVKASAGGGGMGIEEVAEIERFRRVYRQLQSYAKRQFGDGGVLIEQCLRDYNHLEVQLVCSKYGERVHFSSRNCTIQSTGRQKRVEAAPGFDRAAFDYDFDEKKVLEQIVQYSLKLAAHVKYDSVGTWEWIVTRTGQPYLLEVNTRIQVENDISARISYLGGAQPNLIREQIRLGLGERLGYKQSAIKFRGTAIELRIVAEDTRRGFAPWIGTITEFSFPSHPWAAVYTHVPFDRPYPIPSDFDPNLALALVWGDSAEDAKNKAVQFLKETSIKGADGNGNPIITNLQYLHDNLDRLFAF